MSSTHFIKPITHELIGSHLKWYSTSIWHMKNTWLTQSLISWEISFQWAQPWMLVPFAGLDLQEVGPVKIDFNRQSWFDFHIAFMNMGITPIYGQIFSVKSITVKKIKIKIEAWYWSIPYLLSCMHPHPFLLSRQKPNLTFYRKGTQCSYMLKYIKDLFTLAHNFTNM